MSVVYWQTANAFWAQASMWLIGAGVVSGLIAAVFGLIDFLTIRRVRALASGWVHFLGNVVAVLLSLGSVFLRLPDPAGAVMPVGLILLVTGWLGGELAYRYKIGVIGPNHQAELREAAARGDQRQRPV